MSNTAYMLYGDFQSLVNQTYGALIWLRDKPAMQGVILAKHLPSDEILKSEVHALLERLSGHIIEVGDK